MIVFNNALSLFMKYLVTVKINQYFSNIKN